MAQKVTRILLLAMLLTLIGVTESWQDREPHAVSTSAALLGNEDISLPSSKILANYRPLSGLAKGATLWDANQSTAAQVKSSRADAQATDSGSSRIAFLQAVFSGLSLSSILVLMALGLSIIFGVMRVINMAHGEFMMCGAFTAYVIALTFKRWVPHSLFDFYWLLAIPAAFLVGAVLGWICERLIIHSLYNRELDSMLATWGISLLLIQTVRFLFGDTTSLTPPSWLEGGLQMSSGLVLPFNRIFIIFYTTICVSLTYLLMYFTRFGRLLRAVSQDREASALLGIDVDSVSRMGFSFGSGLAGLAGCAVVLVDKLNPQMGQGYIVDSFLTVIVGGIGKPAGLVVSGLGIGFLSKCLEFFFEAIYGKIFVLLLVVILIRFRPSGLFSNKERLSRD